MGRAAQRIIATCPLSWIARIPLVRWVRVDHDQIGDFKWNRTEGDDKSKVRNAGCIPPGYPYTRQSVRVDCVRVLSSQKV